MLWSVDPSAREALHAQIAANVRRALAEGELAPAERLPPARELATMLQVNANTVLAAYRQLRAERLLEFRRGRGVRVCADAAALASVIDQARRLLDLGRQHGYSSGDLARLVATLEPETS